MAVSAPRNHLWKWLRIAFMAFAFTWAGIFMLVAQFGFPVINNRAAFPLDWRVIVAVLALGLIVRKTITADHCLPVGLAIPALILLAAVPRIYLLQNVAVIPSSDYATYLVNAMSLLNTGTVPGDWQLYFAAAAANVPVICGIFALSFKVFGATLATGLYMNVFFYTGAAVALYFIGLSLTRPNPAFLAAALYALWPNHICYSVSLASEPMYVFFLLGGLALFTSSTGTRGPRLVILLLLAGSSLGISQAIRPVTIIFMIALGLVFLFYYERKNCINKSGTLTSRLTNLGLMVLAFTTTLCGLGLYTAQILPVISKPSYGWSVYEGSNTNSFGQWDAESSAVQDAVIAAYPLQDVQKILLRMGIDRLKSYDSHTLALLLAMKTKNLLGNGDLFYRELVGYVKIQPSLVQSGKIPPLLMAWGSLSFWLYRVLALCFLFICGCCLCLLRQGTSNARLRRTFFLVVPVCGLMAVHLVLTSIERYNYPAIPIMILMLMTFWGGCPVDIERNGRHT